MYLVRLEIFEWIKLRHLHQFQENGAGRNFITASRVNSRLITRDDLVSQRLKFGSLSRKIVWIFIGRNVEARASQAGLHKPKKDTASAKQGKVLCTYQCKSRGVGGGGGSAGKGRGFDAWDYPRYRAFDRAKRPRGRDI